jgi:putative hydrolase of the HAD superfamily
MCNTYPKAILFDLDDTILDTTLSADRLWLRAAEHFAERAGVERSAFDEKMEVSRVWFWSDPARNKAGRMDLYQARAGCVEHALEELGRPDAELAQEIATWFTKRRIPEMRPFDGAVEALKKLKDAGVRMALISNGKGETQRDKVIRFGLEPFFDCILLEGEFGIGKPDRRIFDHALNELGVKAQDTWMVGDNLDWEIAAPQKLGMKGVWVDWRGAGLPDDTEVVPDRIIRSIVELVQ